MRLGLGLRRKVRALGLRVLSKRTLRMVELDLARWRARIRQVRKRDIEPPSAKLHLACGRKLLPGWLNVDVRGSDMDLDLAAGALPWRDDSFDVIVSEEFFEHIELVDELLPLLRELARVLRPGGELWVGTPDMAKVCRAYLDGELPALLAERQARHPNYSLGEIPISHLVNELFHQWGEHKNLFDFDLLRWALIGAGFLHVERVEEQDLRDRFPEIPARHDTHQGLYVRSRQVVNGP